MLRIPLLAALALTASACGSASDVDCGPVTGTIPLDGDRVSADLARVTADDARASALIAVPGATITEVELDEEDGFLVYELGLAHDRAEFDVVVDAGSGDVLCTERD